MKTSSIPLTVHEDTRGILTALDTPYMPFVARRVFTICAPEDRAVARGGHAHKVCEQFLICVRGNVELTCSRTFVADEWDLSDKDPRGIYVPPGNVVKMLMQQGSILVVLASHNYDPADYAL